jgi:hypothetical protein
VCTQAHTHIHTHICTDTHMHTHIRIHRWSTAPSSTSSRRIQAHPHTHTHIYTHALLGGVWPPRRCGSRGCHDRHRRRRHGIRAWGRQQWGGRPVDAQVGRRLMWFLGLLRPAADTQVGEDHFGFLRDVQWRSWMERNKEPGAAWGDKRCGV